MRTIHPLLVALLLLGTRANAQQLSAAEYFIDSDPGAGQGTPFTIPSGNTTSADFSVDASALATGFHTLSVRLKDNTGVWSLAPGRLFYIYSTNGGGNTPAAPIASAEYFIDTDPGVGNGTPVSVPGGNTSSSGFTVDVSALAVGFHTLSFRYKDADGRWSLAPGRLFYIYGTNGGGNTPAAPIASAEYFIGADPGVGNGIPLSTGAAQDAIDITRIIDASALAPGQYTLSVRLKDTQGHWGLAESRPFIVLPEGALQNDECLGAIPLTLHAHGDCPAQAITGSTAEATPSGTVTCLGEEYPDVWYTVNSGNSPQVTINLTIATPASLGVEVFDACDGNLLYCAPGLQHIIVATPNTEYWLRVFSASGDGAFSICAMAMPEDCLGVPGGSAQPGTPCDDGNANTVGDVYQGDCVCAGWDCAGVYGGNAGPGSPCAVSTAIDGTSFTGVYDAGCTCTWTDCAGAANGSAYPGNICEDNDPQTPNSYWSSTCTCTDYYDCAGTVNGPLVIGASCDDGNAGTTNDVITAACVCAGTLLGNDCEGVPGGPAQPGTACNDNDACTTGDIYQANCTCAGTFQDTDSDGICDANDPCDNTTDGDACDDGNACTTGDVLSNCACVGTFQDTDSDGICDANDPCDNTTDGDTCDDGNACTAGDVLSNCVCAGTFQDPDGDGICSANDNCPNLFGVQGDACDDGNPNTTGDVNTTGCVCAGTLIGNDCEGVPGGPAQPGTPCDDGEPSTINDLWGGDCVCAGTLCEAPIANAGPNYTICEGSELTMSASASGTPPFTYVWSGTGTFSPDNASATVTVNGAATGVYEVTVSNACGVSSDVTIVTVDTPGAPCDDGDVCTAGDVFQANCTCAGTFQDADSDGICDANDPCDNTTDGDACDDGNACTTGDVLNNCVCAGTFQDPDGDGICSANDNCPELFGVQGDPCDDGNPNTTGDVNTAACICAGTLIGDDCEGVPGGPAQPGTPCNDNDVCTTGDVYQANCACAGTFEDTDNDGVCDANDPCPGANPGLPCDDDDVCTINDVIQNNCICTGTFDDHDNDGICSANDNCPNLFGVQGDACDDGNLNTTGDVITAACVCAGSQSNDACANAVVLTLQEAGGCPALGTAGTLAGATGSDATGCGGLAYNDVWYLVNSGSSTLMQLYLTGDEATGLRVEVLDACGGSNVACLNSFPATFASTPGTDYWIRVFNIVTEGGFSICASSAVVDCEGTPGGPVVPGTPCDDADACTTGDVLDANCVCAGTYQDTDNDGTCDADDGCPTDPDKIAVGICGCGVADTDTDLDGAADCLDNCPNVPGQVGSPCDVGNPCTGGGFLDASCICQVTLLDDDGDGIPNCGDDCPAVPGQQGSPCDDGNVSTSNDVLNAECACVGTACSQNVQLTLNTDANGGQTSYDIIPLGGGTPVCTGSGFASNTTVVSSCCLIDGCYELRVFDSAGDGIVPGGYVLRDPLGKRIIDNAGDGGFGGVSQVANNLGFCLPLGPNTVITAHCDRETWSHSEVIQAVVDAQVTAQFGPNNYTSGYQFWFFDPDGGYSRRIMQTHASPGSVLSAPASVRASYLKLSSMVTSPLPFNTLLNVRVRAQVAGVYKPFGPACRFRIPTPPCLTTQLTTTADPIISCGASVMKPGGVIYATGVTGATHYRFNFTRPGYVRNVAGTSRSLTINNWATSPLVCGLAYDVRVQVSFDGGSTYCPYGDSCPITITCGSQAQAGRVVAATIAPVLSLYPNPNHDGRVRVTLDGLDITRETSAMINVFDALGRHELAERSVAAEGSLNCTLDVGHLPAGAYLVVVSIGDERYMERLIKD
ncbi:MAG: T9SS type A sorting domain-containing protein [Flavobacteriales bacterium]|nr:T9SS type A sorting domain-containing protein [Flavobacteriales bacterium]